MFSKSLIASCILLSTIAISGCSQSSAVSPASTAEPSSKQAPTAEAEKRTNEPPSAPSAVQKSGGFDYEHGETSTVVNGITVDCSHAKPIVEGAIPVGWTITWATPYDKRHNNTPTAIDCSWGGAAVDEFFESNS
jgi:hypothetical protein